MRRLGSGPVRLGVAALVLLLLAIGIATYLLSSQHAPAQFALSTPAAGASSGLAGSWKVGPGSQVGYRVREQFINQPRPTEAVARTDKVTGSLRIATSGAQYRATSLTFQVDLASLVSQDQYATFQVYQRDFFVRKIYLETDTYPTAIFTADPVSVAISQAPGPVTLDVNGKLAVHGAKKTVATHMQAQATDAGIELAGSMTVDMRDYGIDPPDISFTKAESSVVIEYHLVLVRA